MFVSIIKYMIKTKCIVIKKTKIKFEGKKIEELLWKFRELGVKIDENREMKGKKKRSHQHQTEGQ